MNDLLRDKLHHQSSQLAETRDRVRELEEAEKGRLGEIVAILGGTGSGGDGVAFNGGGLGEIFFIDINRYALLIGVIQCRRSGRLLRGS